VRVEVLNSSGAVVYTKNHSSVGFGAGDEETLKTYWQVPGNQAKGWYRVRVRVYQPGGTQLIREKTFSESFYVR
jgi:hypothetical protein